jgi:VacB/RNase II family 3'-5' exoribonuclease
MVPPTQRNRLQSIARAAMRQRGLEPEFSPAALAEVDRLGAAPSSVSADVRDMRNLLWCSIDNEDSRDLDQLTVAEPGPAGQTTIRIAVADVSAVVARDSAIDKHARQNTTSVYTEAEIFPMLPLRLSTDLTSLNFREDRLAVIVEAMVDATGSVSGGSVYRAVVRNRAKLNYNEIGAWLDSTIALPDDVRAVDGLDANLRLQDEAARRLATTRHQHGALDFDTQETRAVFEGDVMRDLKPREKTRAGALIEDFMIAANGVTARFLEASRIPALRRIVKTPARWGRIVTLAAEHGTTLPAAADSKALADFLKAQQSGDPDNFPVLSLAVLKLLGRGEYVVEIPGDPAPGHFGLAVEAYTHSTAPNRRFPDLITQRLIKSALARSPIPFDEYELRSLAFHCTQQEDAANKVERAVRKSAAALLLTPRIGEKFDSVVTGASPKGTWVKIWHPPVEGKLAVEDGTFDVGDRVRVKLVHTDVERGFIDFAPSP